MNSNPQYAQLANRLNVARRAYKRMTTLAGAVVFLIEALGTAAIVIAADVLFDLAPAGRIALFAIAAIALVYFAIRHIVKPLTRQISDQQLALYLEQRNPQFEGSLIAATEFGTGQYSGRVAQIVDSILDQAVARAGKFDLRKAIDLGRLRKYGAVAIVLLALYGIAAIAMPQATSRRMARVFTPWKAAPVEIVASNAPTPEAPLTFALGAGDSSIVRGGTLQLQASASRTPHEALSFHFRSTATGADASWKSIPMSEIEKVNTFQLTLPDVNEDLEYFVAAENVKSEPHRVTVFDPLLVKSYEVVTKYPAYLKFPDRTDKPDSADITAVQGSSITLKIHTNGPLASGKLAWDGRDATIAAVDANDATTAAATFEATASGTFKIALTDVHGQAIETPAAALTAAPDAPPTIKLTLPAATLNVNPLAEVPFVAEVADDLALDHAVLVVTRGTDPAAVPARVPLSFDTPAPSNGDPLTAAKAVGTLMLETIQPPLASGDSLSCYVEVTDRNGQTTPSDLLQVVIVPFESWAAYSTEQEILHPEPEFSLEPTLQAAWRLNATAKQLAPNDLNRQLEELAKTMTDDKGALHPYFSAKHATPVQIPHGEAAMKLAQGAHDSLMKHDTPTAVNQLRAAIAELSLAGVVDVVVLMKPPTGDAAANAPMQDAMKKMTALMEDAKPPAATGAKDARTEKDEAADTADQVAKTEAIEKAQADLTAKAKKAADGAEAPSKPEKDAAADAQGKLAEKADAMAKAVKEKAGADADKKAAADALAAAAAAMKDAAAAAKKGDAAEAARKADAASKAVADAKVKLQTGSQDAVNKTIDQAQAKAEAAARKQADVMAKTDAVAKADGKDKAAKASAAAQDQVKLAADAKALAAALDALAKAGDAGALKPDTAKKIADAKGQLTKGRLEQHITNAAVQLAAGDTAGAATEQKKVKDVLDKVGQALADASNTRAGDKVAALRRAKEEAADVKDKLAALKAAAQAKADGKPGDAKDGKAPTEAEKKQMAEDAAGQLARLAKQLQARDFSGGNKAFDQAAKSLAEQARDQDKLAKDLQTVAAKPGDLEKIASALKEHLEDEYDSTLKSQQLFAAQREDCPPQYRPLVNQYFESLSTNGN